MLFSIELRWPKNEISYKLEKKHFFAKMPFSLSVRIGGMLGVTLEIEEYRRLQTYSQPNRFTIALAEKLYGMDQLATATVTGKDSNKQLDPQITIAIKNEVLRVFGSSMTSAEQERMWNGCIASIAGKCKNIRYARKKALELMGSLENSNN